MKPLAGFAIALSIAGAGCATSPEFHSQAAPDAPLASYRTYAWAFDGPAPGPASPLTSQAIRDSLDRKLRGGGLTPAPTAQADMIVAYTLGARDRVDVTDWGPVAPYYPGYGRAYRYGWAYPYRDVDVRTVTEGSLALDIFDAATRRPAWHGIASQRIGSGPLDPELIETATQGLVDRFLEARAE